MTTCPADHARRGPSYELLHGGEGFAGLPAGTVIIREIRSNHLRGMRNVGYADGSVELNPPGR